MPVPSGLSLQPELNNDKAKETTPEDTSRPSSPMPPDSPRSVEDFPQNKLFVGALAWETKEETLKKFFSEHGEVLECCLMLDGNKKSRGFAFITFKDPDSVKDILDAHSKEPLKIDNKIIDPKLAVPPRRGNKVRRIFVGGLSSETDEEDMKEFFAQFGEVEEVQLMYDRQTNRHRGFGFITYIKPGPAEKLCSIQFHDLKGKKVEVKVAQTKEALALQAGKARTAALSHGYSGHTGSYNNFSPTYPQFYPSPYPLDIYSSPPFMLGSKPRTGGLNGNNKIRITSQFSPPAFFGGYSYPPSDHNGHITSPQFYSSFNGLPNPYFMRGPEPPLSLNSPPVEFIEQFQAMAMMGGPYTGMSPGSPPNTIPVTIPSSSFNYQNGDSNYSPPSGITPKGSPTGTPINGYTQVPSNFTPAKGSFTMQQTAA